MDESTNPEINKNQRTSTLIILIGYFFVGSIPIMLSPALPSLIRAFDLTLSLAGTIFVARSAGSFVGVAIGGVLSDKIGRKPVLILGCLLQGLLMLCAGFSSDWLLLTLLFALIGLAGGLINPVFNAWMAEIHVSRKGAALNTLHGVYSLGALIGPIAAGFLLSSDAGWQAVFWIGGLVWLLYGLSLLWVRIPKVSLRKESIAADVKEGGATVSRLFIFLFLVSFLYNGTATSLVNWINTYLDQVHFPILLSAGMVSLFYLGLSIGRLTCSLVAEKTGYTRLILICSIFSLLFYPLSIWTTSPFLIACGVFLSGLFFSGLHPTSLALANQLYPHLSGTVSSMLGIAMTLGAMIVPWMTGFVADRAGFRIGFSQNVALLVVLVFVAARLRWIEKRRLKEG